MGSDAREAAARLMELFGGHSGAHGTHGEPTQEPGKLKWEIKSTARTVREPPTAELWERHLAGERPLGVISIREDSTCLWGSIDVDQYDGDLLGAVARAEKLDVPLVPCRSKSGGLHLFLFLSEPQPAGAVQAVLRDAAARIGLAGSEVFPKQTKVLAERGDLGNWMVMPYFGSTYGGKLREQVGVKRTGAEMTLPEFLRLAEGARVDPRSFELLAARPSGRKNGKATRSGEEPFADGPPCLQHLSQLGVGENEGRNNALFHVGVYFRRKNPGTWKRDVEEANQKMMRPPLASDEVTGTIRSLEKRDYEYTCKAEPMCSHCDSGVCRSRRWGVGGEGDVPSISGLSKLDTRPAIWFVDVAGVRLELTTDQLLRYDQFQRACAEEANHVYGPLRQPQWTAVVQEAMANVVTIEAPGEVGVQGRFLEHLEDFLTNRRTRGRRVDDLFSGRPWECEDEGRWYFRMQDLQKFLNREDFRDEAGRRVGRNRMTTMIERLGGGYRFWNVRQRGLGAWWVPSYVVEETPDLEPDQVPDAPV